MTNMPILASAPFGEDCSQCSEQDPLLEMGAASVYGGVRACLGLNRSSGTTSWAGSATSAGQPDVPIGGHAADRELTSCGETYDNIHGFGLPESDVGDRQNAS